MGRVKTPRGSLWRIVLACIVVYLLWRNKGQESAPALPTVGPLLRLHVETEFEQDRTRNPVNATRALRHDDDLVLDPGWSGTAAADKPSSIAFDCNASGSGKPCPLSYKVLFIGPTMHSPLWEYSHRKQGSRRIAVDFRIRDPGKYMVYVWPEYEKCDKWNSMEDPYSSRLVSGAPFELVVTGSRKAEKAETCPAGAKTDRLTADGAEGRWVSLKYIRSEHLQSSSPYFWWLKDHIVPVNLNVWWTPKQQYAWLPYDCKRPSMNNRAWIELVRPTSLLVVGDSTLRDFFCLHLWTEVGGWPTGLCNPNDPNYHRTNKEMVYLRHDGGNTTLRFLWSPAGDANHLASYLGEIEPPSHVLLNNGLWLAKMPPSQYKAIMNAQIGLIKQHAPLAKVALRESASSVQSISCYERIGGFRSALEAQNRILADLARSHRRSLDIAVVPFYDMTNDRPDTSIDGRHWSGMSDAKTSRPQQGVCESAMADWLWWNWFRSL